MVNEKIQCFENIIKLSKEDVTTYLSKLNKVEIVKASMGASPEVNELLKGIFNNIDFESERKTIGSVRIKEIEDIHEKVLAMVNDDK